MSRHSRIKRRLASHARLEFLEDRRLLTALVVTDTPNVDAITLGVTASGGIKVVLNGVETDYKAGAWDSVSVNSSAGADTVNVEATVVPSIVHYMAHAITVNVGDATGVQNIKASLNMNGVSGGPIADGTAAIFINDTGDAASRTVSLTTSGDKQIITGLAPAEISIGVVVHPLSATTTPSGGVAQESLTLATGAGADAVTISSLRASLPTALDNAGGNDSINIGNGSLAQINSPIFDYGRTDLFATGFSSLKLDDSSDVSPAQFTLSAIYPPGPGATVFIDFQGTAIPTQRVSMRVAEVSNTTLNGGSGGNSFTVNALPGRVANDGTLALNTGGGNDNAAINATAPGTVVNVDGQAGNETFFAGPLGPFASSGVNGNLNFAGGPGTDSLTIFGPQTNPFEIPSVSVIVTAGLIAHRDLTIHYTDLAKLQLEHGNYQINEDLGLIALFIASEKSDISFESATDVTFNATQHLQTLDISAGTVQLAAGAGITLHTNSLHLTGGTLDLANNSLQVHYAGGTTPFSTIRSSVLAKQIFSSSADARHTLGYADSADNVVPNFAASTVLVTYALEGDANLDKTVGFGDLVIVAQHYGQSTNANWDQGDFNYDGAVGFADLVLLAQNYGSSLAPAAASIPAAIRTAVPVLLTTTASALRTTPAPIQSPKRTVRPVTTSARSRK